MKTDASGKNLTTTPMDEALNTLTIIIMDTARGRGGSEQGGESTGRAGIQKVVRQSAARAPVEDGMQVACQERASRIRAAVFKFPPSSAGSVEIRGFNRNKSNSKQR
jgi:hypothetical protein